jgi:hypothetical protein
MISHALDHQSLIQGANYVDGIMRIAVRMNCLGSAQEPQITCSSIVGNSVASCQMTVEMVILKVLAIDVEITIGIMSALDPNLINREIQLSINSPLMLISGASNYLSKMRICALSLRLWIRNDDFDAWQKFA